MVIFPSPGEGALCSCPVGLSSTLLSGPQSYMLWGTPHGGFMGLSVVRPTPLGMLLGRADFILAVCQAMCCPEASGLLVDGTLGIAVCGVQRAQGRYQPAVGG